MGQKAMLRELKECSRILENMLTSINLLELTGQCHSIVISRQLVETSTSGTMESMKLGAKMRKDINIGLLKLMEDGSISQIKNKWWKKNSKCNQVMEFLSSFADLF